MEGRLEYDMNMVVVVVRNSTFEMLKERSLAMSWQVASPQLLWQQRVTWRLFLLGDTYLGTSRKHFHLFSIVVNVIRKKEKFGVMLTIPTLSTPLTRPR